VACHAADRLAVMGEYARTDWSSLREVRIDFANPDADSVEDFSWEATSFYSIGAEFALNDSLTLRGGFAYDETPTSIATRTPRLPDENRRWFSIGLGWELSESFEINAAYTRIEPDTPKVDLFEASTRHTLEGEYSSDVNLFGLSGQFRF
jgi:long-chain fatty acid transport protein